jgi:hypothetical protein
MASSQYNSFIVAPDPQDPNYGPSADNIPIISGTPGAPVTVASITNTSGALFYNVAANLLPQPTGASYAYRFTFNASITAATLPTAGNITCMVYWRRVDNTETILACQTIWVATTLGQAYYSISAIFTPATGDFLKIYLTNNTGSTITNVTLAPTQKGNGIELVSKATTSQLIFS